MIIRVEKHTSRYTVVDNTGLNDSRLHLKARGLLAYLLTKPDNWEVTVAGIVSSGPDGRDVVQSSLRELERFGYAELKSVRGVGGKLEGKKWVIFENPQAKSIIRQLVKPKLSPRRQAENPSVGDDVSPTNGFSDTRFSRESVFPQQVSTVIEVNTDLQVSTDNVRGCQKKSERSKFEKKEKTPPVAARPPQLFADSEWFSGSADSWLSAVSSLCPGISMDQAIFYHGRCLRWSLSKSSVSTDWPLLAAKMFTQDLERQPVSQSNQSVNQSSQPVNQSSQSTHESSRSNSASITSSDDRVRATKRAARFVARNGFQVGPID